ncbi:MAG: protein-glutamate O-methyltransferase CheR [Ectothiorhodospiraceae bacterium]|nr:protein-glutamate O-methyltransferase CheR [Chromatiales bacterium]MCP5154765.1 protein-glutamate O-methyltransferase CheR [Ectothiorhodospiraceae bacterium]
MDEAAARPRVGAAQLTLSDAEFERLRRLVREHTGISLSDAKRTLVYGRISRRIRALGLSGFPAYCALLEKDGGDEIEQFTNAITTNLTSFFRESHHFDYLRDKVVTPLKGRTSQRLRIWSAGCSTGEEPYSIAITLAEALPRQALGDVRVLATDIDSNVLRHAEAGVYDLERVAGLPEETQRRWFKKGAGPNKGKVRAADDLRELISFRQLNLLGSWPMRGPFDVIFCRNVVIYFDRDTQRELFKRYADMLPIGGHLFIGHSESLFNLTDRFELVGRTVYRRIG